MEDSEFRREFERETVEIAAVDAIVNALDELTAEQGKSKADLAREIGKNPASIRGCSHWTAPTQNCGPSSPWPMRWRLTSTSSLAATAVAPPRRAAPARCRTRLTLRFRQRQRIGSPGGMGIAYYQAPKGGVPADELLDGCPIKVEAQLLAVLEAVRRARLPPSVAAANGRPCTAAWAATTKIRCTGPGREHFRLFCILENGTAPATHRERVRRAAHHRDQRDAQAQHELFTDAEYRKHVHALGEALPRRSATEHRPVGRPEDRADARHRIAEPGVLTVIDGLCPCRGRAGRHQTLDPGQKAETSASFMRRPRAAVRSALPTSPRAVADS